MKTVMVALIHPKHVNNDINWQSSRESINKINHWPFRKFSYEVQSVTINCFVVRLKAFPYELRCNYFPVHYMLRPIFIKHGRAKNDTQRVSIEPIRKIFIIRKSFNTVCVSSQDPSLRYFIKENRLIMPHTFP